MKNLFYLALALLFSFSMNSQTTPAGENISLDQQLSAINQSTVTSGIIYERAVQIANLYNFNRTTTFNTANYPYFKQALLEMNKASNGTKFITVDALKNRVEPTTATNEVDLAVLNTQFQILNYNEDNPLAGGLTYNTATNKFAQIVGKVPFYTLNTSVIAPMKETVSGTAITYKIRSDLFFQNGIKTIKTLTANFGDGEDRNLITNFVLIPQNITVNYTTTGIKTSTFVVTYTDNSTITTHGKLFFVLNNSPNAKMESSCMGTDLFKEDKVIVADEPFTGYDGQTFKGQIEARIFYHKFPVAARTLLKPIIVIDGFDPGDVRKIEDCDCEGDPTCNSKNQKDGAFSPSKHDSFVDLMEYYNPVIRRSENLVEKLRSEGYDVILVNQPNYVHPINPTIPIGFGQTKPNIVDGGADYIERNALALVKLMKEVNSKLIQNGSTSKVAVFGPSMGGQISRYALAYMEKKYAETGDVNWKHNTYLWVSVDSPHLGANIPMGVQSLLNLARGDSDGAKEFYEKSLASPAAQQQIMELHRERPNIIPVGFFGAGQTVYDYNNADPNYLNSQTTLQNMSANRGSSFFQQHYNNQFNNGVPNSKGWPVNLRKIAMTNGSLTGSKETVLASGNPGPNFAADGEKVINIRGFQIVRIYLSFGMSITWRTHIASLESMFMPSTGNNSRICRFKKHFNDRTTNAPNYNTRGVMDNVPGGYFKSQALVVGDTMETDPISGANLFYSQNWSLVNLSIGNIIKSLSDSLGGSDWSLREYNPIHSFIPTYSALAITNPNHNWNNPLNTNLTCPTNRQTPFDSYYGESKNSEHTSFTYDSVNWLLKELAGNPQAPHFPIQAGLLTGPDLMCNPNTNYSFLDDCKLPSTVTWSVTNLNIVSSTPYSINVSKINGGQGTITATFQNGQTVIKNIWIGSPQLNQFTFGSGNNSPCITPVDCITTGLQSTEIYASFGGMSASETNTNSNWEWTRENNLIMLNGIRNRRVVCPLFVGSSGFKVRAKNACGWSEWVDYPSFEISTCFNDFKLSSNIYKVFPNPSKDIVNIVLKDQAKQPEIGAVISGELFNMMGLSKSKVVIKDNAAIFSVVGLLKGIYVLKIYIIDQVESHQIGVE